jgi:transcriptional regulator with XRE-family HTH domain
LSQGPHPVSMNDLALGRLVRMVRRRRRLKQSDVARRADTSQDSVSLIERGRIADVMLPRARRICAVLEIELTFEARWRGPELERLADAGHARIVELVARTLRTNGWQVLVEHGFSWYGERGRIDVVGWHEQTATLLIVEVKTDLVDLQAMLGDLDRSVRVAPRVLARERGWRPKALGVVLVVDGTRTVRRIVDAHSAIFESALPARTVEVRRWLRAPSGSLRGIWFVDQHDARARKRSAPVVEPAPPASEEAARSASDEGLRSASDEGPRSASHDAVPSASGDAARSRS